MDPIRQLTPTETGVLPQLTEDSLVDVVDWLAFHGRMLPIHRKMLSTGNPLWRTMAP